MKIALIVIIAIAAIAIGLGFFLSSYVMRVRPQTLEQARAWQEERLDISWYDTIEKMSYTVNSFDGYELHVQLLVNPVKSDNYVIITHGYTDNRIGSLKYAGIYLDQGFNVMIYDLRGHGENEPSICTYTLRERKDLRDLIKDTKKRFENVKRIGIHGESLGAATSIAVLNYQPEIDFVVADCPFGDISKVLKDIMKTNRLPGGLVEFAGFFIKLRYKVSLKDMKPCESLEGNRIPILFIHGKNDMFIPSYHSEMMVTQTEGLRDLRLVDGASHAYSVFTDRNAYSGYIREFLSEVYSGGKNGDQKDGTDGL